LHYRIQNLVKPELVVLVVVVELVAEEEMEDPIV
jgi:hypothetical protein